MEMLLLPTIKLKAMGKGGRLGLAIKQITFMLLFFFHTNKELKANFLTLVLALSVYQTLKKVFENKKKVLLKKTKRYHHK